MNDIRLSPYQPAWKQEFEQTRSLLLWATEGWIGDVQHIGGTTLEEGISQPIVDVLAGMADMRGLNEACALVEGLNYRRVETPGWCDDELVAKLCKPRVGNPTHSILILRLGGKTWQRINAMQHWLETHYADVKRLQNVKLDAACISPTEYERQKAAFFLEIEHGLGK
jgi:GrpB-like predicted nucleotidyltransferase (UPF0157 family)